ncbi:unnamed protein product [Callosobruchus maculatus]|uniref:Uncharacterized protein n=1 Tax=Callosobruchus maculatus TaxID=64391 RepID=A0A653D5N9_CALMS|nr:unnamed protein product [Callosobruchus maculatus]
MYCISAWNIEIISKVIRNIIYSKMKNIIVILLISTIIVKAVYAECVWDECVKDCQKRDYSSGQCLNFYGVDRCICIGGHHNKDCQEYCREIGRKGGTEWYGKCICV